jgi:hypothetical protein
MSTPEFTEFPKIARLSRECVVTEKIDGTNAVILIDEYGGIWPGSRSRWITPEDDNFGFARWVKENQDELIKLGPGRHFGEWWGSGIQRGYGLKEKRFSLFNVIRWCEHNKEPRPIPTQDPTAAVKMQERLPACVSLVPELYRGLFDTQQIQVALDGLLLGGSAAAPGFLKPEGIVVFHIAGNVGFKKTIERDETPKLRARGNRP